MVDRGFGTYNTDEGVRAVKGTEEIVIITETKVEWTESMVSWGLFMILHEIDLGLEKSLELKS